MGSTIDSATAAITAGTWYTIRAWIKQRRVEALVVGQSSATFTKDRNTFFGTGKIGVVSDKTSVTFDDFTYSRATPYGPGLSCWYTSANISLDTGNNELTVTRGTYGGEVVPHWAGDDDYIAQADINFNSRSKGPTHGRCHTMPQLTGRFSRFVWPTHRVAKRATSKQLTTRGPVGHSARLSCSTWAPSALSATGPDCEKRACGRRGICNR